MAGPNRSTWVKANFNSNSYKNGYKVFNEYMNHGVYLLYTSEKFSPEDQSRLEESKIKSTESYRGFIGFGSFYAELKKLYARKPKEAGIKAIYPTMIQWCKDTNAQNQKEP
jgi:hypothetical protein